MDDLYNTVLNRYRAGFATLTPKTQFHLASRLHLWSDLSEANQWLRELQPAFTAHNQPLVSVRQAMAAPVPKYGQTGRQRAPYFTKYPSLQKDSEGLFRLLFLNTVYGLPTHALVTQVFETRNLQHLYNQLLSDEQALRNLSSVAINYLYLYARFVRRDDAMLPLNHLLNVGGSLASDDATSASLACYYYTHCIIAESLFYARPLPAANLPIYQAMLERTEQLVNHYFGQLRLDNCLEFLVCCRLIGGRSALEERIMERCYAAIGPEGYLVDQNAQREQTLSRAEHRNVLFLMSQTEPKFSPEQPNGLLLSA